MLIEFGAAKNASNRLKHGVSLRRAEDFDWREVLVQPADTVKGEPRQRVLGLLDGRLFSAIVTPRGERLRIISLRPANPKERRVYENSDHA